MFKNSFFYRTPLVVASEKALLDRFHKIFIISLPHKIKVDLFEVARMTLKFFEVSFCRLISEYSF